MVSVLRGRMRERIATYPSDPRKTTLQSWMDVAGDRRERSCLGLSRLRDEPPYADSICCEASEKRSLALGEGGNQAVCVRWDAITDTSGVRLGGGVAHLAVGPYRNRAAG